MIGVLTHHWAKDDLIETARELLDRNGDAQSRASGFVGRETFYSLTDPTKITTMVKWTSNEIYEEWRASPERAAVMTGADAPLVKAPRIGALPLSPTSPPLETYHSPVIGRKR